jgi:hypothetical protein
LSERLCELNRRPQNRHCNRTAGPGVHVQCCAQRTGSQESTGLISTTGVPSITSIGPIRNRFLPTFRTVTRCSPSGFGRSGDRVANTPASARCESERGWTWRTSRRPWCSQVTTKSSSPLQILSKPRAAKEFTSNHASGAPSEPCFGAPFRFLIVDRIVPIGRSFSRSSRTPAVPIPSR